MFYCPGYMQMPNAFITTVLIKSYLDTNLYNTLEIDWTKYAMNVNYFDAARDSYYVGKAIATYLQKFIDNGIVHESIEIIGVSLGAQMASSLGQNLRTPIPRIVGLDPAGPGFRSDRPHFSKGAAEYTVAIHTDMGGYGTTLTDADLDIIVNGGHRIQPGCPLINIPLVASGN
ncbi:lipase member H-like [Chrysoperla carnea]|uniref:lipase member H-like n=1 Tax=Chrysoperla carnea TaxID=189513 RepID=UPI001D091018|nr:lipase member H-like [Chrysoperla carnea]